MPTGKYKRTELHRNGLKVPHKGSGVYKRVKSFKRRIPMSETEKSMRSHSAIKSGAGKWMKDKYKKGYKIDHSKTSYRGEKVYNYKGGYQNKLLLNNQRRIKKSGNGGIHTLGEWENLKAQYNWTCPRCHLSEPKITLSRDHIIAVVNGGSDNIENIQPLCRSCNSIKNTKTIKY